jgi:hypothetical protein
MLTYRYVIKNMNNINEHVHEKKTCTSYMNMNMSMNMNKEMGTNMYKICEHVQ